jgi:hypothetical protein
MADQVDQLYAVPNDDEQKLAKHNRLAAGGRFVQTAPTNTPYVLIALRTTALGSEVQRRNLGDRHRGNQWCAGRKSVGVRHDSGTKRGSVRLSR